MDSKPQNPTILWHLPIALAIVLTLFLYATHYHRQQGKWAIVFVEGLPTLVILAIAAYWAVTKPSRYRKAIVAAFFCSLLGSYCLAMPKQKLFLQGVAAFFCANLCYITAFTSGARFARRAAPFLIVGLPGAAIMLAAWPNMPGNLKLPLLLYAASIISISAQAITRALVVRRRVVALAAIGATLLLVSDSMIAVNRFYTKFWLDGLLIAVTYFAGQWLIATSVIGTGADD